MLITSFHAQESVLNFKTESNLIHRLPYEANGYLILNSYENPDVVRWEIEFLKYDPIGTTPAEMYKVERVLRLQNLNYTDELSSSNINQYGFINVIGYSSSNAIIASDGPIGYECEGCAQVLHCMPTCNGKTSAYSLRVISPPGAGYGNVLFSSAVKPNGSPYYEYFNLNDFNNFFYNQSPAKTIYYGFIAGQSIVQPNWNSSTYNALYSDVYVRILAGTSPPNTVYKNKDGITISGDVYGIKKTRGYWNYYQNMDRSFSDDPEAFCAGGFGSAALLINNYKNNWNWGYIGMTEANFLSQSSNGIVTTRPSLTCDGTIVGVAGTSPSSGPGIISKPCKWGWTHTEVITSTTYQYVNGVLTPVYTTSIVYNWVPCGGTNGTPNDPFPNWVNSYEYLTLSPMDPQGSGGPIIFNPNENTAKYVNSEVVLDPNNLAPGLYHAFFQFPDQSYLSRYIELSEGTATPINMSFFLTAGASPVPVAENQFNLNLDASADVHFTYKLITTGGVVLFEREYFMSEDEDIEDRIRIDNYNEPGVLINQFLFEDGSYKSFSISKM